VDLAIGCGGIAVPVVEGDIQEGAEGTPRYGVVERWRCRVREASPDESRPRKVLPDEDVLGPALAGSLDAAVTIAIPGSTNMRYGLAVIARGKLVAILKVEERDAQFFLLVDQAACPGGQNEFLPQQNAANKDANDDQDDRHF